MGIISGIEKSWLFLLIVGLSRSGRWW